MREALADEPGIDFRYCASWEDAVRCAEETRATVILQDLGMPGTDGLTLVRQYRLNAATRDIPIVVLSTNEEPLVKSAAFAAGSSDYLVKRPDRIELIARIRYHSRSYLHLLQRDEAYRALRQSQRQLLATNLELQRLTHSDGLTGLSNRRYLDQYLATEWHRGTRDKTGVLPHEGMLPDGLLSFRFLSSFLSGVCRARSARPPPAFNFSAAHT
ncbi:PleD family two-component response regulator [Paraburkholderia sp. 40]